MTHVADVAAESDAAAPVDLRPPTADPWADVSVPPGWEPTAGVAREVAAGVVPLAERIVDCITAEIPSYAGEAGLVPRADIRGSVVRNLEMMLVGLAEHRGPSDAELAVRRGLGHRRALQDLPVDAVIQAFRIGYRELWQALVQAAPAGDTTTGTQLLEAATTVWQWMQEVTDAIAGIHSETVRSQELHATAARQRFTELLVAGEVTGEEVRRLAWSLSFDPDATFVVMVVRTQGIDGLDAAVLERGLRAGGGAHAVVPRGPQMIAVSQGAERDGLAAVTRLSAPGARIGIGLVRDGLSGARGSLRDAEQALEVVGDAAVADFDELWLWASLQRAGARLAPLLAPGVRVARDHPHLSETVMAYAQAGFSISAAARQLGLHANTVAYRLDRWHELVGWSPRTFPGLVRSLAALHLTP